MRHELTNAVSESNADIHASIYGHVFGVGGWSALSADAEADKLFDKWMNFNPKFNDFLYEDVKKITNMGKCTITELIDKFDTAKYFQVRQSRTLTQLTFTFHTYHLSVDMQNHGKKNFFTISILSRIHLSRFETGSEQERVFSSGKKAMDKDQTNMDFEMLRIRTLLSHNKQLI